VHAPASAGRAQFGEWRWLDRAGKAVPDASGATGGADATISRSGTRWARSQQGDIWLYDMGGGAPSRFTFEPTDDRFFTWSPDDQWIAYATGSGRAHDRILRLNTVKPSTAEVLVSGGTDLQANDWSRDGKFLLFTDAGTSTGWDMWTLDLQAKAAKPVPYLQTPGGERFGAFSPDGRWIAYQSDESGQLEVYVQSFPPGAGKFQVSAGGGISPRWRADGRELYFRSGDSLTAVTIETSPRFAAGVPQKLFSGRAVPAGTVRTYDVTPDGSRFLVAIPSTNFLDTPSVTMIVNWQAGLKAKLSTK
jgi:tricorn protease-like protein